MWLFVTVKRQIFEKRLKEARQMSSERGDCGKLLRQHFGAKAKHILMHHPNDELFKLYTFQCYSIKYLM